ncbi:molybdenum cofactor biosynthesis protein E [Methanocaldococcus bathoardescens]|uniref:Molybdenum cofactor biosynthesis protein E n=1 Tax=Methanocaldococcus bathoardescens TaxID=1301915 RepID=A0A076LHV0_9EURY|nr:molybdenum cofactor biosynthesis protein MoaE [Methanocaldococcus bathoardescens]AIJ06023.1 molybdenum cofactor biosynthesis protein E [Methanocaldococcus bathoardescens]
MIFNNYEEFCKKMDEYIEKYKGKYGCVVTFNGFVREYDIKNGEKIPSKGMHIDENILEKLKSIIEDAKNKFDVIDILFYHNTGFLNVGERIASIAVFARHRKEGFEVLEYIINEMKKYH